MDIASSALSPLDDNAADGFVSVQATITDMGRAIVPGPLLTAQDDEHPGDHGLTSPSALGLDAATAAHPPMLTVESPPSDRGGAHAFQMRVKRAADLLTSALLLVLLLPVMLVIAVAITLDSPGPVFYNRTRVGRGGRHFTMFKFRTMVADAEHQLASLQHLNAGGAYMIKIPADPRVTRVGRFLRASSLDELPQLLNVLRGEMSLIGPRPQAPNEVALYTAQQRRRLDVRPGITGLWQVRDRHNPSFDQWIHWDLTYIADWSIWLDTCIMFETVLMIVLDLWRMVRHGTVARS